MGRRLRNSWELVKASGRVLMADRELLVFPLLSAVAAILVSVSFFVPAFALGGLEHLAGGGSGLLTLTGALLFYIVLYTVTFFFNSALVGAALIRLDGGDPTVKDGLRIAGAHFGPIVGYAAIAATVGMVLNAISSRSGLLGRVVVGLVGVTWNLATYLTVPVLVSQDVGPVDAVKQSAALFRRTWGEQVAGHLGMGVAFFFAGLSLAIFSAGAVALAGTLGAVILVPTVAGVVLVWILFALSTSALKGIYAAALYRFARTGEAGWGFEGTDLRGAFRDEGRGGFAI